MTPIAPERTKGSSHQIIVHPSDVRSRFAMHIRPGLKMIVVCTLVIGYDPFVVETLG